jgi:hypothetical protein
MSCWGHNSSHVGDLSTTFASHVKDLLLASASHARSMSPSTTSHVGGINMIENHRRIGCKPKLFCRLFKGNHLTCLFPATTVVHEAQSLSDSPSGSEPSLVSQLSNPSLVDTKVMSMQS